MGWAYYDTDHMGLMTPFLSCSVDPYGLVGQWLADALNPSVYTYEVSPVFSLMEEHVLAQMRTIVGFQGGDGIFCPGGSMANGYAISCARHHAFPQIKVSDFVIYLLLYHLHSRLPPLIDATLIYLL